MRTIFFRTDGNSEIATGHLMRSLAVARACRAYASHVRKEISLVFLVSDAESAALLAGRFETAEENTPEFPIAILHSDYRHPLQELTALSCVLTDASADGKEKPVLFIDSYFVNTAYFKALHPYCHSAYLDDLRSFPCPVDLVINYDTDADCGFYSDARQKLLGASYTPLRAQFGHTAYEVRPHADSILISAGGTDPYAVSIELTERLLCSPLQDCHIHILTSTANTRYGQLLALSGAHPQIQIHENVSDVASLMASCDLAVSAGGTTLNELCSVGVPTISYLMADNQKTAVSAFDAMGLIPCAGDIRPSDGSAVADSSVLHKILLFLTSMSQNVEERKKSSQIMRAFSDGRGAERIAEALFRLSSETK